MSIIFRRVFCHTWRLATRTGVCDPAGFRAIDSQHLISNRLQFTSGRGGIRTHGGFPHARFRVECLKPDSATLPLRDKKTPNAQRRTSNIECNFLRLDVERWALDVERLGADCCVPSRAAQTRNSERWQTGLSALRSKKMLQFKACHVGPTYCILYVHTDSHAITCC